MTEVINKIVDDAVQATNKGLLDGNLNLRSVIFQAVSAGMSDAYDRGRQETDARLMRNTIARFDSGTNQFTKLETEIIFNVLLLDVAGYSPEVAKIAKRLDLQTFRKYTQTFVEA